MPALALGLGARSWESPPCGSNSFVLIPHLWLEFLAHHTAHSSQAQGGIAGVPCAGWELDSMVPVGPIQLSLFCDSTTLEQLITGVSDPEVSL